MTEYNSHLDLEKLSAAFLEAAKLGQNLEPFVARYDNLEIGTILNSLKTDAEKKAFWINSYNAFTLLLLRKNNGSYGERSNFFTGKHFTIANLPFSLDDMEHGILRRGKHKNAADISDENSLGNLIKSLFVDALDFRIHFALNCGAVSCPPIKCYTAAKIEEQLDLVTKSYLEAEIIYREEDNIAFIPALFKWYAQDFGTSSNIIDILKKYKLISATVFPTLSFSPYNWQVADTVFNKSQE